MQNQEHMYPTPEPVSPNESQVNTDPREQAQPQEYSYKSYTEGYPGSEVRDIWSEGQKLQPMPKREKSMSSLLAMIALLMVAFLAGGYFASNHIGALFGWLSWVVVTVLVIAGAGVIASNWRVVTIPMPTRTFQVGEHTHLMLNNSVGTVAIRRGAEGVVSVDTVKRASGLGIDPASMQVRYDQNGDTLNIASEVNWNIFQFGLRSIDFEITVPTNCDIQMENGSGKVTVQGTRGNVRVRTGSGSMRAYDLQGEIAMKTGSGHIEAGDLQGRIDLRTGSSRIEVRNLQGQINLRTGSSRIEGDHVQGQLTAQTGSGRIELRRAALQGYSSLKTGSSSITFEGSLDPNGSAEMRTGSGSIRVQLPTNAAFSLDAKTGSGGVHNEFGSKEVGERPRAQLKLRTGSSGIYITRDII